MAKQKNKDKKTVPVLAQLKRPRSEWEGQAPRLTHEQQATLASITRGVYQKISKEINRKNFADVHASLEDEIVTKVGEQLGLKAGVEWRGIFPSDTAKAFNQSGLPNQGFVDGILPTNDFLQSEIFEYIEVFQPRVVLFQFEDYDAFMKSAEEAIEKAEKRRERGDAYFAEQEKALNYRPEQLPGSAEEAFDGEDNG